MKFRIFLLAFSNLLVLPSCSPFADLQTARMTGKGQAEITPFATARVNVEDDYAGADPQVGSHLSYGLSDKFDARLSVRASVSGVWIQAGPKFSLWENRLAAYIPVGKLFLWDTEMQREMFDLTEFQPTLLYTHPLVKNKLEWNASAKWIQKFATRESGHLNAYAFNTSLAFGRDLRRRIFILEYGTKRYSLADFEDSYSHQLSFGIVFKL